MQHGQEHSRFALMRVPFAISTLLQDWQLEVLDGNLINFLLPLAETLFLVGQHGFCQRQILGVNLQTHLMAQ